MSKDLELPIGQQAHALWKTIHRELRRYDVHDATADFTAFEKHAFDRRDG